MDGAVPGSGKFTKSKEVFYVGPDQEDSSVPMDSGTSSIILKYHPWEAKGPTYLKLSRSKKDEIIWDKIMEDTNMAEPVPIEEFFSIDMYSVFDEIGDEIDCRRKTKHSQG